MKGFLKNHSYDVITMFLNQAVIAMFGFTLVLATMKMNNDALRNAVSAFAAVFYLFLLYMKAWDIGFKDKIAVEQGRKANQPLRGALISLCANSINFCWRFSFSCARFSRMLRCLILLVVLRKPFLCLCRVCTRVFWSTRLAARP